VKPDESHSCKRPYALGKRLEQMSRTKAALLTAARKQLEAGGAREFSMESLAKAGRVTRQTVYNLFGTRSALLEALFDQIAVNAGMDRMRGVMTARDGEVMLDEFIRIFADFWVKNRMLLRRIHGIAAIDPEFGKVVEARNRRRQGASTRVIEKLVANARCARTIDKAERVASLVALTSFEFFDALAEAMGGEEAAQRTLPGLIRRALSTERQ
jgi:AcrR family transcriptional regulator